MRKPNQVRTREDAATRRNLIVDEAVRMIGKLGSRGFTIQGLAEQCGLSNAGLLYYFGSKDDLLLSVIDEIERREELAMAAYVTEATSDHPERRSAYEAMCRLFRRMIERISENPEQGRFIIVLETEALDSDHPAHQWFRDRVNETEDLVIQLIAPWVDDRQQVARLLVAIFHGLARRWFECPGSFDLGGEFEKAVRRLVPGP